jgi:hypothetical protein
VLEVQAGLQTAVHGPHRRLAVLVDCTVLCSLAEEERRSTEAITSISQGRNKVIRKFGVSLAIAMFIGISLSHCQYY